MSQQNGVRKTSCPKCGRTVDAASLEQHIKDKHGHGLTGGLVLSRKLNERVIIDGKIAITVVALRGDKVRLHFSAPPEVQIHREEIQALIQAAQQTGPDRGTCKEDVAP
jgi:carbon storage regulator